MDSWLNVALKLFERNIYMNKFKLLLAIVGVLFVFNASSKGWSGLGKITKIVLEHRVGESDIYIKISSVINTTCPRKDYLAIVVLLKIVGKKSVHPIHKKR